MYLMDKYFFPGERSFLFEKILGYRFFAGKKSLATEKSFFVF